MLTGTARTGFGSRIGGHARRGGGRMRKEHQRHCLVAMTDEYRSSKTCVLCLSQAQLIRGCRIVNGPIRTFRLNGSVECVDPQCLSFKVGYTIKARDTHSAATIASRYIELALARLPDPSAFP
ncbi:hypothetical protein BGZ99_006812 [Dissophora globulifera]|uniref:Uncharacterized protein n=1 Tax=Dissophora globulifera TaxID=979702 RepID=A0A9P6RE11_9FUNG|nr:hypothetical protein BGZ99_006812 [Dissophora globulifera]